MRACTRCEPKANRLRFIGNPSARRSCLGWREGLDLLAVNIERHLQVVRRPVTVAATALVVGQPLGPRSVALPAARGPDSGCSGRPEAGAVPLAVAGVFGEAGGAGWVGVAGGT